LSVEEYLVYCCANVDILLKWMFCWKFHWRICWRNYWNFTSCFISCGLSGYITDLHC